MCDGKARGMKGEKNSILFGRAARHFRKYRLPEKFNGGLSCLLGPKNHQICDPFRCLSPNISGT